MNSSDVCELVLGCKYDVRASPPLRIPTPEAGIIDSGGGIYDSGAGIYDSGARIIDSGAGIIDPGTGIYDSGAGIYDSGARITAGGLGGVADRFSQAPPPPPGGGYPGISGPWGRTTGGGKTQQNIPHA